MSSLIRVVGAALLVASAVALGAYTAEGRSPEELSARSGFHLGVGSNFINMATHGKRFDGKEWEDKNYRGLSASIFGGYSEKFSNRLILGLEGRGAFPFAWMDDPETAKEALSFLSPSMTGLLGYDTSFGPICLTVGIASFRAQLPVSKSNYDVLRWAVAPEIGAFYEWKVSRNVGVRVEGDYAFRGNYQVLRERAGEKREQFVWGNRISAGASLVYHF
ncbi:MAG: hypothetical protein LBJ70_02180 [Holosporales bacterium]|jgi:hypothetical protein|nr:hypothetical protein [Holosporales bacterium]